MASAPFFAAERHADGGHAAGGKTRALEKRAAVERARSKACGDRLKRGDLAVASSLRQAWKAPSVPVCAVEILDVLGLAIARLAAVVRVFLLCGRGLNARRSCGAGDGRRAAKAPEEAASVDGFLVYDRLS